MAILYCKDTEQHSNKAHLLKLVLSLVGADKVRQARELPQKEVCVPATGDQKHGLEANQKHEIVAVH
jgi:hypothetical protein